jgi:hypothetical protein
VPLPGSLAHRTRRDACQHLERRHRVAQDGDERWEGVSNSTLTQKRMQERFGFFVWDSWSLILGWAMPKEMLSEPPVSNWSLQ